MNGLSRYGKALFFLRKAVIKIAILSVFNPAGMWHNGIPSLVL